MQGRRDQTQSIHDGWRTWLGKSTSSLILINKGLMTTGDDLKPDDVDLIIINHCIASTEPISIQNQALMVITTDDSERNKSRQLHNFNPRSSFFQEKENDTE